MRKETVWHKLVDARSMLAFNANNMLVVEVHGKKITIGVFKDQLFAFAHKCPHASGIMAEGFINAMGHVICPLHRYAFNMQNGRNTTGEGYYLKVYPLEERGDGIYIGIVNSSFF